MGRLRLLYFTMLLGVGTAGEEPRNMALITSNLWSLCFPRSFVPTYESVANATHKRIATLNKEHSKTNRGRRGYVNKPYTNLHFTAIDCAVYSSICSKESITSYPTMIMQNVNKSSEKISGPSLKSATKFINEKYFSVQVGSSYTRANPLITSVKSSQYLFSNMQDQEIQLNIGSEAVSTVSSYVPKMQKLSFLSTSEERFEDALMSLDYMLLREIPQQWSAVRTFLRCWCALIPTHVQRLIASVS